MNHRTLALVGLVAAAAALSGCYGPSSSPSYGGGYDGGGDSGWAAFGAAMGAMAALVVVVMVLAVVAAVVIVALVLAAAVDRGPASQTAGAVLVVMGALMFLFFPSPFALLLAIVLVVLGAVALQPARPVPAPPSGPR
jgi:hypothetical protein